jgi:hypothetical protein
MVTIPRGPTWALLDAFETVVAAHPVSIFGRSRLPTGEREAEEALDRMPAHLRSDLGLPPVPAPKPEHPAVIRARNRASRWGS